MNRGYPPTALGRPALAANRVGREAGYVPWGASGFLAVLSRTRPPPRLTAVSQRSDAAPVRGPYLDASDPDPSWPAPSPSHPDDGSGAPTTRRRALLWVMAVVGLLTVTVAALAATGGFRERADLPTPVAPGTTLSTGPYELTFIAATAQRRKDFGDSPYWEVRVTGTGRTTGEETIAPSLGVRNPMFLARAGAGGEVHDPEGLRWGTEERISDGDGFTPGLPPVPFSVEFTFPEASPPTPTLRFAVFEQEFRDISLLGNQDPTWTNGKRFWVSDLPVRRLPDETG